MCQMIVRCMNVHQADIMQNASALLVPSCLTNLEQVASILLCKNAQFVTDLPPSCNKSVHQVDIRMRSHCLFTVVSQNVESCNNVDNFLLLNF